MITINQNIIEKHPSNAYPIKVEMSDKNKEIINHTIPINTSIAIIPMINNISCIIAPIVLLFLYIEHLYITI